MTRSDEGFRIGSLSTRSKHKSHSAVSLLTDLHRAYSISATCRGRRPALSQCTVCYTLLMGLKRQDWCGRPGHLRWNSTAATSHEAPYGVGNMPWQASTIGSSKQPSWKWRRCSTVSQRSFLSSQSVVTPQRTNSLTVSLTHR